ncbi:winged helix DNA-binding protein [Hyphomicrobium facile]|uniref:Winged helix DNA-binding domain-containing protein n=1 Tax=Hyphomicrobium facile TaxID=51670 RepID=A0A1I7N489_9HYPH|nr:winged helix DNA-binding protein [Hyphomicrobium facile]SFV29403.1 Winged helix DNA-binding domain-containing protein [Hyphomicrobium facile]
MRVDWNERIGGIKMIEIRDFLRVHGRHVSKSLVSQRLSVGEETAMIIVGKLLSEDFVAVEDEDRGERRYKITDKGCRLASTRAVKRIDRHEAVPILHRFHARIEAVNARRDLIFFIREVRLFGSFIDPLATDYGDLDVAIDFQDKSRFNGDLKGHCEARADLHGRFLYGWHAVKYCKEEVRKLVAARDRYISVSCMVTLERIKAPSEPFYIAPDKVDDLTTSEHASAT